jgi:hypothetical protein
MRSLRWSHLTDVQRVREVVREWAAKGFGVTIGPMTRTPACVCRMVNVYQPTDRPAESPAR